MMWLRGLEIYGWTKRGRQREVDYNQERVWQGGIKRWLKKDKG